MLTTQPYAQYQQNQALTATPGKLVLMAFDAAIRFAHVAQQKMKASKLDEQSEAIGKAQAIVAELICSLDVRRDAALAERLATIYEYIFHRLSDANVNDDEQAVEESIRLLSELRETWGQADRIASEQGQRTLAA